ncbi:putative oxidoreductase [Gordonia effusa NBRC 100432]|uniref:Putative oxidoreductase n=1 Tax=Gordonia effusa NBRC 100432 TaxID=1077974 RepID=H0QXF6_9ACTN|nr:putative oxidoreductase [Gordonia effusa NBRC 100432]
MKDFRDKVAVITGAGSGIGRGLALRLADEGAALALSDIDSVGVAETAAMCEKVGVKAVAYPLDVADKDAVYQHADDVISEFGGPTCCSTTPESRWGRGERYDLGRLRVGDEHRLLGRRLRHQSLSAPSHFVW